MPDRSRDWLAQAERDLRHARHAAEAEDFEWACFAAQQAAEKAVKGLIVSLGGEPWGHSITTLLLGLPAERAATADVVERAKILDKHYIQPRYPGGFDQGAPGDYYTRTEAQDAIPTRRLWLRSAGIIWVDRERVVVQARVLAERMRALHPEVLRVILFGSFARGRGGPRSDLDLVVIVERSDLAARDRPAHYAPTSSRPLDVFVYTRAEVEQARAADLPPVLRTALREGIDLLGGA